ncbi:hypothetical protein TNCV_2616971 [Trichonephila clavipes]|nr:hypothetical protein TNCV_2616971 [Trichonephila clavipes]
MDVGGRMDEVVFTDESRICLQHHDGRIRVWRRRGEKMLLMLLERRIVMHRHTGRARGIMFFYFVDSVVSYRVLKMEVIKEKIKYILQFFFDKGENASQVAEIVNGVYGADTATANYV